MRESVNFEVMSISGVCVVASLFISIHYGLTIAETPFQAGLYSSVGAASVVWEYRGLNQISDLWARRHLARLALAAIGLVAASAITISYEFGYLATLFEGKASIGEAKSSERASLEAERQRLAEQIAKAGIVRPVEAIEGDLAGKRAILARGDAIRARAEALRIQAEAAKADAAAEEARRGCGDICRGHLGRYDALMKDRAAVLTEVEAVMRDYEAPPLPSALAAELGTAKALETAGTRIRELNDLLKPLADARVGDARAHLMAKASRGSLSEDDSRLALIGLFIFFLFLGRVGAPYVFRNLDPLPAVAEKKPIPAAEGAGEYRPADMVAELGEIEESGEISADMAEALYELESEQDLIRNLRAPSLPAPINGHAEPALDLRGQRIRRLVESFIHDCLLVQLGDDEYREGAQLMQDGFQIWLEDRGEVVSKNDFGIHMTACVERIGGKRIKSGSWYYVGVRFKPAFAARVAEKAAPISDEPVERTAGRRLGTAVRRRDVMELEAEEAAGTA